MIDEKGYENFMGEITDVAASLGNWFEVNKISHKQACSAMAMLIGIIVAHQLHGDRMRELIGLYHDAMLVSALVAQIEDGAVQ